MLRIPLMAVFFIASFAMPAQDKVLSESIDNFKGTANEVAKQNPVLAVGSGQGVSNLVKSLTGRRYKPTGPAKIELPKEQQEELERRQKAKELEAKRAGMRPKKQVAVAPPAPVYPPGMEPIPPVVMAAILYPAQTKPAIESVKEEDLSKIAAGTTRETVVALLGKPASAAGVNGLDDGSRETLTYRLDERQSATIRLHNGRVQSVSRN